MTAPLSIAWYGPTDGYWAWILRHFRDVRFLRVNDLGALDTVNASVVVLTADHRCDEHAIEAARSLDRLHSSNPFKNQDSQPSPAPWCLLLGTDWSGHRRTNPLPESWRTFYWYELFDRMMPWLMGLSVHGESKAMENTSSISGQRKLSPRVQRWIDNCLEANGEWDSHNAPKPFKLGLVVAETSFTRDVWMESLARRGVQAAATTPDRLDLWLEPELIIVDLESEPLVHQTLSRKGNDDRSTVCERVVKRLRLQYPTSIQIVTTPFPRWDAWQSLDALGVDVLVGKPYFVDGLLSGLSRMAV
jgi:hypothetical protein